MQYSYSRIERYYKCPYSYKLYYQDKIRVLPDSSHDNALYLGVGIHKGIETTVEEGLKEYFKNYPIATSDIYTEAMKMEVLIPKVKDLLLGLKVHHEVKLYIPNIFVGYIDALIDKGDGYIEIIDFKYSNNKESYLESAQLHVYAMFYQLLHPEVKNIKVGYVFIPKYSTKRKFEEDVLEYRQKALDELKKSNIEITYVPYSKSKAMNFLFKCIEVSTKVQENIFPKKESGLCYFCEYRDYCLNGETEMLIPVNKKRNLAATKKIKMWVYGTPMSGKTFLANTFPDVLFLNTDGNLNSFDSPVIQIKDQRNPASGRIVDAFEVFKMAVDEIIQAEMSGTFSYKTVVVDLLEDVFTFARKSYCLKERITHESEQSMKAYDVIRKNFLGEIQKLANCNFNLILLSHEDKTRDLFAKGGDKVTSIQPILQEKVALKVAGMMDLVLRLVKENVRGKPTRRLCLPENETIFGGSRLKVDSNEFDCNYEAIKELYDKNFGVDLEDEEVKPIEPVVQKSVEPVTTAVEDEEELRPIPRKRTQKQPVEETNPIDHPSEDGEEELPF